MLERIVKALFPKCRYCHRRHIWFKNWCPENIHWRNWIKRKHPQKNLYDYEVEK